MKLTLFLFLLGMLRVSASTFYSNQEIEARRKVTVACENVSLEEALRQVLGNGYSFRIVDNMVVIRPEQQMPEERKISGVVKDRNGAPLPGVAVVLKGTTVGTATDMDGKYTLTLPEGNYTLVFSMLGMKVREELVGDRTEVNVVMEEDATEMDEVVVTGIFKKARESYTGAVSSIDGEELQMFRGQNLLQTLKNIDVSINLMADNINGSNPNRMPQINIRGNSSLHSR